MNCAELAILSLVAEQPSYCEQIESINESPGARDRGQPRHWGSQEGDSNREDRSNSSCDCETRGSHQSAGFLVGFRWISDHLPGGSKSIWKTRLLPCMPVNPKSRDELG